MYEQNGQGPFYNKPDQRSGATGQFSPDGSYHYSYLNQGNRADQPQSGGSSHTPFGRPLYSTAPSREPAQSAPPQQTPPPETPPVKKEKKAKRHGAGFVAAMLAVSIIGGAAGGGGTAWYLMSQQPPAEPASQSVSDQPEAPNTQTSLPAEQPEQVPQVSPALANPGGDVTAIVQKASVSVVEISIKSTMQTFFGAQEVESAGSGVIYSEDGYIVTNNHVVEGGGEVIVRTSDGTEYTAELIGTDPKTDLAVIKIDAQDLIPVTFADSDAVQVGELAVAIGNPLGTLGGTVTNGIVSAKDRELTIGDQTMTLMQTSAAINPGNSGGGLFNANGELIGVVNAKSSGTDIEGLGFAIPSNTAKSVADDLIEYGYVTGRPELGITVLMVTDQRAAAYYGTSGLGLFVMEVTRENGLKPYDRIIAINGEEIESATDVSEAVLSHKVGDSMRFTIERDGERMEVDVSVAEQLPESVKASMPKPDDL